MLYAAVVIGAVRAEYYLPSYGDFSGPVTT